MNTTFSRTPAPATGPARPRGTPGTLWLLLAGLAGAALAWGALTAWTVSQHAAAAGDVVSASEPLSLDAQRMYQALSDADVTATTAFLAGPQEPLAARQRFQADITQAATDLTALKSAAAAGGGGDPRLASGLAAISAGLPSYTGYVAQAQSYSALGYPLTGGSFIQVASEEMHLTLLPAARTAYAQENARLTGDSAAAAGLPWMVVAVAAALVIAVALYRTQRWLARRTHRMVNYGLVAASLLLAVGAVWLVAAFLVARSDLQRSVAHGSAPTETLAQAGIAVQQARGDEILNLISRSGDTSFVQNFQAVRRELGPGSGTLLSTAAAASQGGPGAGPAAAAVRDASPWYTANEQVYRLDVAANYAAETRLVIGTGPGSSAAGFQRLERDLSRAVAADQVTFRSAATAGAGAFGGLEAGIIVVSLLMAAGCAWGISRRLAEYR
jgi:hypothetical protein